MTDSTPTAIADFVAALGELAEPTKSGKVAAGARKYTYLTLPDLIEAVRPVLAKHRLAFTQDVAIGERSIAVVTTILHTSGESWHSQPLELPLAGRGPQDVGSALTYARRYSLATMVGLAGADDTDGRPHSGTPTNHSADTEQLPPVDPETGEILEPDFEPASSRPGDAQATPKQVGMIQGLLRDQGVTDRALILEAIGAVLGREVTSSKELTKDEASKVIQDLKGDA